MKETYDIIIRKLERDKLGFEKEIASFIDYIDICDFAKEGYNKNKAQLNYCNELIEFFKDIRSHL